MKLEWRKNEKAIYLPKAKPEIVNVSAYQFICIQGEGNPNKPFFADYIKAIYSVAYSIKMNLKKAAVKPQGYIDWTVYPLEGVWDINDTAKKHYNGEINKNDFVFKLMIRQPDFVNATYFNEIIALVGKSKPQNLLNKITFEKIVEGLCVQMLHVGSFNNEAETFNAMETFANTNGYNRLCKTHREIYISDFRKVAENKLKTVLRFKLEPKKSG
ncbi:GyrI-like domain-containing protein [Neotamlana nanhaiensis]|nr:GyrI-like domain-containing protein [Tamlana nanhaiensis]